jgi:DinB family protein
MKVACLPMLVFAAFPAFGQSEGPLMSAILPRYETAKMNLVEAAEAMPEGEYSYRLTPGQRTFGDWIDHNARMNYNLCSQAAGQPAPRMGRFSGTSGKAELVEVLKSSFAYCDTVFHTMTDQKALSPTATGPEPAYPVDNLVGLIANWNAHYGNLVGYLRTKGIMPPSTTRAQKKK